MDREDKARSALRGEEKKVQKKEDKMSDTRANALGMSRHGSRVSFNSQQTSNYNFKRQESNVSDRSG